MIIITALRLMHAAWTEARALQRETLKRYPNQRGD